VALEAVLPPKVPPLLLELAGILPSTALGEVSEAQLKRLLEITTGLRVQVRGTRGFEHCQLSAGGVPVTEVDIDTLESKRVKGLYLAGEVLDVVGPCGGYNLQFAFSSGAVAGQFAGQD
jgi:predicted flavoprotein YhiN